MYREKADLGRWLYCGELFEVYEAGLRNDEKSNIIERARKAEKSEWRRQFNDRRKCRAVLTSDMSAEVRAGILDCQDDFRHAFELDERGQVADVEALTVPLEEVGISNSAFDDLTRGLKGLNVSGPGADGNVR